MNTYIYIYILSLFCLCRNLLDYYSSLTFTHLTCVLLSLFFKTVTKLCCSVCSWTAPNLNQPPPRPAPLLFGTIKRMDSSNHSQKEKKEIEN